MDTQKNTPPPHPLAGTTGRSTKDKPSAAAQFFDRFSTLVTKFTGRPVTFLAAVLLVVVWAFSRPLFGNGKDAEANWELIINTATTIITFLMVFVIQQSQNKDTVAIHLKLNELIAANKTASNRLVNVEDLTEKELAVLKQFYIHLSELSEEDCELFTTHSIDEAKQNHTEKYGTHRHSRSATVGKPQQPKLSE